MISIYRVYGFIHRIAFLIILISISLLFIALFDFILAQNLLGFTIFVCLSLTFIVGFLVLIFIKYKKKEEIFKISKKERQIYFEIIPMIIIIFIIITFFSKQYGLTICIGLIFIGYILNYLISLKIRTKYKYKSQIFFTFIIFSSSILFGFLARGTFSPRIESQVWKMHEIDNPGYLIPNGLDAADLNKDGFDDYLTNYEWDGKIRISFYPGVGKVKENWPAITIGNINNAENAAFGDFDNDGNVDVVVAHGSEFLAHSGVNFIWSPDSSEVMDESLWIQSLDIPKTIDLGHIHYVRSYDINKDNATDIIIGGRGLNPKVGLRWIEAPKNSCNYRNLSEWQIYDIDPDLKSGHGFIFGDIDQDGDDDITGCNSDWDTPDSEEMILWYENPGPKNPSQKEPWPKHIIYKGSEFYSKEQVILHDFTGDNFPEVIMQTINHFYIFKNPQDDTSWEVIRILKPYVTRWRARPIKIGDINGDNKSDILGMLIHYDGNLPIDKAAVFWMTYSGYDIETAEWETHVIKWGDGFIGIGQYNGEKWDQCLLKDIDRDGDLDIVANCEEFHTLGFVYISVVWFENPRI